MTRKVREATVTERREILRRFKKGHTRNEIAFALSVDTRVVSRVLLQEGLLKEADERTRIGNRKWGWAGAKVRARPQ